METALKENAVQCLVKAKAAFEETFKEALRLSKTLARKCRTEQADGENVKLKKWLDSEAVCEPI